MGLLTTPQRPFDAGEWQPHRWRS